MTAPDKNGVLLVRTDSVTVKFSIKEIYPDGTLALESFDNPLGNSKTTINPIESTRTVKV